MTTFATDSSLMRNDLRPFLLAGYSYDVALGAAISGSLRVA